MKIKCKSFCYRDKCSEQEIVIFPNVLQHFHKNRQSTSLAAEVGGQLFARILSKRVYICLATGPAIDDKRGRFWFVPNQKRQNDEIRKHFQEGLHFVGDWHTHPEPVPNPSETDLASMADCFNKSRHQLKSFVMVIVGQTDFPAGLWVSLHNKRGSWQFFPSPVVAGEPAGTPSFSGKA